MVTDRVKFDLSRHFAVWGHGNVVDLGLDDIRSIEAWSGALQGPLRTRALGALLHDRASEDLIDATADSIAMSEQWQMLLRELLCAAEFGLAIVATARKVLAQRLPEHPLSARFSTASSARMVYDALAHVETITFRSPSASSQERPCLIFDPNDIVGRSVVTTVKWRGETAEVPRPALEWLAPIEVACPAFALVA